MTNSKVRTWEEIKQAEQEKEVRLQALRKNIVENLLTAMGSNGWHLDYVDRQQYLQLVVKRKAADTPLSMGLTEKVSFYVPFNPDTKKVAVEFWGLYAKARPRYYAVKSCLEKPTYVANRIKAALNA